MAKKVSKKTARKAAGGKGDAVLAKLSALNDTWKKSRPGGVDVAEGKYQVKIEEYALDETEAGDLVAVAKLSILSGESKGRKLYHRARLVDESSLGWFKGDMEKLGLQIDSMEDVPAALAELVGTYALVAVKHKGERDDGRPWVNVYYNQALDESDIDADGAEAEAEAEEEAEEEAATTKKTSKKAAKKTAKKAAPSWKKGAKVQVSFDGDWYQGTITAVNTDDETATIDFEDGTTDEIAFGDIEPMEAEAEEEAEEEAATTKKTSKKAAKKAEPLALNFDDDSIDDDAIEALRKLAKKAKLDPDDYATWCDLTKDLLEKAGKTGGFDTIEDAIEALA
jgi:hypothetical protein